MARLPQHRAARRRQRNGTFRERQWFLQLTPGIGMAFRRQERSLRKGCPQRLPIGLINAAFVVAPRQAGSPGGRTPVGRFRCAGPNGTALPSLSAAGEERVLPPWRRGARCARFPRPMRARDSGKRRPPLPSAENCLHSRSGLASGSLPAVSPPVDGAADPCPGGKNLAQRGGTFSVIGRAAGQAASLCKLQCVRGATLQIPSVLHGAMPLAPARRVGLLIAP